MMTREFIKQLRERGVDDGHVVHISRYSHINFSLYTPYWPCVSSLYILELHNLYVVTYVAYIIGSRENNIIYLLLNANIHDTCFY